MTDGTDREATTGDRDLQDLVAEALAAHDNGGETALLAFLSSLGHRAAEVRQILDRFLAVGVLARPLPAPELPERLGEFRLLRKLGAGGMGVVFLAQQSALKRDVALKVVRPELLLFEGARERFRREVDAVARLRHPAIVPIVAVGEDRGIPYFAMELVEGRTAEEVTATLRGREPASLTGADLWQQVSGGTAHPASAAPAVFAGAWWQVAARLCAQVARAMRHAHVRGIVHRDLKPSNIMLTPHGQAMVLDFGLAHVEANERITRTGSELGSPAYMSPEQVRGEPIDERTDIYSLGATLHQILCLVPPFQARDAHELRAQILIGVTVPPRAKNRALPRDLELVCLEALDVDRHRRYASMADFAADLEAAAEGRAVAARRLGLAQRTLRWARRHRAAAAALAVALAFLAMLPVLLWLLQQQANRRLQVALARAQRNLDTSKQAVQTMLVRFGEVELGSTPGAEGLRVKLLEDAVALYERLLADQSGDAALRLDRANTLAQLGKMFVELGRHADAERVVNETVELSGGDALEVEDELLVLRTRARQTKAVLQMNRGDFAAARATLERKRAELDALVQRGASGPQASFGLVTTLQALAECARQTGKGTPEDGVERERLLRRARELLAGLRAERPDDPSVVRCDAAVCQDLAFALQDQARHADAQAVLDEEIALVEPLPSDKNARPRRDELLMLAFSAKGSTHFEAGEIEAAVDAHARSVTFAEQLVRDFPAVASYTSRLGTMLANLAVAHQRLGEHAVAVPLLRRAIEQQRAALERTPDYAEARRFLCMHHNSLARNLRALGRGAELVALAEDLARAPGHARESVEAAGILADAASVAGPAEPPFDRAAAARRAVDLLLEVDRRGWPQGLALDARRFASLGDVPELAALLARHGR